MKIGIVSFTDPRPTAHSEARESYIREHHISLKQYLLTKGFSLVDPMDEVKRGSDTFGIRTTEEVEKAGQILKRDSADCLILGLWHWTEPQLPLTLVRSLKVPTLLYAEADPTWAGSVCVSAVGASLWEAGISLTHHRVLGDKEEVAKWARGVLALQRMRKSAILLWGGSYCLRMEHLQDDIPYLKSFLIGDVLSEDQYILIKKAEDIERSQPERIEGFLKWLESKGAKIMYDSKMLTPDVLKKQISLYLASKDRLEELKNENIIGVSIKCQPELSEIYGVDACSLPAFLPFGEDSEGEKTPKATVCEGDIKGLLTCALLEGLKPGTPSLFGDLKFIGDDYVIISNCGASSIYYASFSNRAEDTLPHLTIAPQCQGASGGAFGYDGKEGTLTIARLTRIDRQYIMQLGLGKALPLEEDIKKNILWGNTWPHIAIDLGVSRKQLVQMVGANHLCALQGDYVEELEFACREAGLEVWRFSSV
ncbi:fucose isomerase [bacterium]|nr:fucose isomerase [bacterium]